MPFIFKQKITFKHCDMAGIVFFPRYFEMINDCNESFFDEALNFPFIDLHKDGAVPMVDISTQFLSPGHLGDLLEIQLTCTTIGRTSLGLSYAASCDGRGVFNCRAVLVRVDLNTTPIPWPDPVREKLAQHLSPVSG